MTAKAFTDDSTMPFGKHKGERLGDVPASYLRWFAEQKWSADWPELETYVNQNWKSIQLEMEDDHDS